jgi:hypothetical protein
MELRRLNVSFGRAFFRSRLYSSTPVFSKVSSSGVLSELAPKYPAVFYWEILKNGHVKKHLDWKPKVKTITKRIDSIILSRGLVTRGNIKELFASGRVECVSCPVALSLVVIVFRSSLCENPVLPDSLFLVACDRLITVALPISLLVALLVHTSV